MQKCIIYITREDYKVSLYFVLIKCLNLRVPYLRAIVAKRNSFKGIRMKALNTTQSTLRMFSRRCENCPYNHEEYHTQEHQPCAPGKAQSLEAIQGDGWLISPKSFSDRQSCPKMAAWEVGKLFVLEGFKQGQHDHFENKTFSSHLHCSLSYQDSTISVF